MVPKENSIFRRRRVHADPSYNWIYPTITTIRLVQYWAASVSSTHIVSNAFMSDYFGNLQWWDGLYFIRCVGLHIFISESEDV